VLFRSGANLNLIQRQLGHECIESTLIYLRTYPLRVQNEYNLYIPSYN
jgi:site-specific recombinase XerD